MTHIEQAIRDAVENGYRGFDDKQIILAEWTNEEGGGKVDGHFLLDRAFWQALGKARGWENRRRYKQSVPVRAWITKTGKRASCPAVIRMMTKPVIGKWKAVWHRFIDHLAEGKDAESFFATL